MKHSGKFWISFVSCIVLGTAAGIACWGGDWDYTQGSMFAPEILRNPSVEPFFRVPDHGLYNSNNDDLLHSCNNLNVDEWDLYFEGKVSKEALNYWLYKAEGKEVNNMILTIKGTTKDLPALSNDSKTFTLLGKVPADKATGFLYYVGFAKRNETFTTNTGNSWGDAEKDAIPAVNIDKQIEGGLKFYNNAKSPLLKERYLFQIVRLYYFNKQYKEAIDLYNGFTAWSDKTTIRWRAMEYAAGAYYRQKEYSKANYLFSLIYDHFDTHKESAYLSFHPQEEKDWEQCLAMAQSPREKAILWQMFGIYRDPARAIREIYRMDPKSDLLDLLVVRAVNVEEERFTPSLMRTLNDPLKSTPSADKVTVSTISDIASKGNTLHPMVWNLAAAYLNYEEREFAKGDAFLKAAQKTPLTDELIKDQVQLISLVGKLNRAEKLDARTEKELLPELKLLFDTKAQNTAGIRMDYAERWARNVLAMLYANNKEYEKSEMILSDIVPDFLTDNGNVRRMIAYYESPKHSELEQLFMGHSVRDKRYYQQLLGIRFAQQDLLDSALVQFNALQSNEKLYGNPFTIHIKDCHDCDHAAVQKTKYTAATFVEKMIEMKNKAKANKAEAAQNYFLVANGFYNITYYGNARDFYAPSLESIKDETAYPKRETDDRFDCKLALKYYLLARNSSADKEFKAKCTFMAAKCEQNTWYGNIPKDYKGDFKSGTYFRALKKEYADTKYYAEIIKECSYFALFNSN